MIHLLRAEMQKVWKNHFFLLSLLTILGANLFLLWFNTTKDANAGYPLAYQTLQKQLSGMDMQEIGTFLDAKISKARGLLNIDTILQMEAYSGMKNTELREEYVADFEKYYELYQQKNYLEYENTLSKELVFLETVFNEFKTVNEYEKFLDSIAEKEKNLMSISIFSNEYDIKNIHTTAKAFEKMRNTPIEYYPQKGLMTALNFSLTDILAILGMISISTVLVRMERENHLLALIRSAPAGRTKTAIAKLFVLAISLLLLLIGLYGSNLIYCDIVYGLGPLSRSIQSVPQLMGSIQKLTVGEYLVCFFFTKWAAALVCGVWVMLSMIVAKRFLFGVLYALVLIFGNLLVRTLIPATSHLNVIKYANLVSLLNTNELLGEYRNLYWFGTPVPLLWVESIAAVLLGFGFMAVFLILFHTYTFSHGKQIHFSFFSYKYAPAYTTVLFQEGYKIFVMQGVAVFILLFACFQVYLSFTTRTYTNVDEIYYQYYMSHLQGSLTHEKIDWLKEQSKEFEPIHQLNQALTTKKITQQQYQVAIESYNALIPKMNVFERVVSKIPQLSLRPRMQMIYETGWLRLFDTADRYDCQEAFILTLIGAICFSGIFSMEKQTGMIKVISTTPLGREKTVRYKLFWTVIISAVLSFFSLLPRFCIVIRDFGIGAWIAPVYSISNYQLSPEIPMFMMIGLLVASRFLSVLCIAFVTLALSQYIGNNFKTIFISWILFSLSPLLSISGFTNAKWCSIYPLMHTTALLTEKNGMIAIIMIIFIATGVCYYCINYLFENFGYITKRI